MSYAESGGTLMGVREDTEGVPTSETMTEAKPSCVRVFSVFMSSASIALYVITP
jgi:hypothetical protein